MDATTGPRPSSVRSDTPSVPDPNRPTDSSDDRGGRRLDALRRNPDVLRFWAAQSVSLVGSQVTLLALPLIAALTLEAGPFAVGLLAAAETAPFLLVGLFADVWVDRLRRRPILIATDLGRAALLLLVPLAGALDLLGMGLLYAVALLSGVLTLFFDVAFLSYLPALVRRDRLVEGNARLQASASTAQVIGPGLAGGLIQLVGAPAALHLDVASFLVSGVLLRRNRTPEPAPIRGETAHVWREIGEGLRVLRRNPTMRALAARSATANLFAWVFFAVDVLYLTRELELTPGAIGLVFATGGVGALLGAVAAGPLARRFGPGPTIVWAQVCFGVTGLVVPLAVPVPAIALPMVVASEFLQWGASLVYDVNALSLRQATTLDRLQGRVNATMRFLVWGMRPFGSLLGGLLGAAIGLPRTLVVRELGMLLAVGWLLASPLPRLQHAVR